MTALRDVTAAVGPILRRHAVDDPPAGRFDGDAHAFVLEAVYEGFLMHYGEPRAFEGMDADLRLLAGDALYALGLERLAQAGDLDAIAELSDLISLCAWAAAHGRRDLHPRMWDAAVRRFAGDGPGARAELAHEHGFSA